MTKMTKIAYIEWEDTSGVRGSLSLSAAQREGTLIVRTSGILVREDEEAVSVAQDTWVWTDLEGETHTTMRDLEVIPRGMVRRLEILEILPDGLRHAVPPPPVPSVTADAMVPVLWGVDGP